MVKLAAADSGHMKLTFAMLVVVVVVAACLASMVVWQCSAVREAAVPVAKLAVAELAVAKLAVAKFAVAKLAAAAALAVASPVAKGVAVLDVAIVRRASAVAHFAMRMSGNIFDEGPGTKRYAPLRLSVQLDELCAG